MWLAKHQVISAMQVVSCQDINALVYFARFGASVENCYLHSGEAGFLIQFWLQRLIGPQVGVLGELAKAAGLAGALDREFRMTWIGEKLRARRVGKT